MVDKAILDPDLGRRLRGAAGFRNLIAHQYGVLNVDRVFPIASGELDDLLDFCQQLALRAGRLTEPDG